MIFLAVILYFKIFHFVHAWHHSIEYNFKINPKFSENEPVKLFESVYSNRDYFQLLSSNQNNIFDIDDSSFLIGARNYLYQLKLPELDIISNQTWSSSQIDTINCLNRSIISNKDECDNYIKLYLKINENLFKICSTNALNPKCRFYGLRKNNFDAKKFEKSYIINETSGIGQAPLKAYESKYVYNYVNNRLYTANSIDLNRFFTSIDGLYDQDRISTNVDDNSWIHRADFISSFSYDRRIFFIFNEDDTNTDDRNDFRAPQRISQIGHVCENDRGAPLNSLRNIWTTYLKAKLSCVYDPSINSGYFSDSFNPTYQKSSLFYFDEIKSISKLYMDSDGREYFYGVFTTSSNTITASAICRFSMDQIMESFHGDYKIKSNQNYESTDKINKPKSSVPSPRPSDCPNELTYQHLIFSRKNFIMEKEILSNAVVVESSISDRFLSIDVDSLNESKDVLYIGTENGRVLTFVLKENEIIYSEEIEVFNGNSLNFNYLSVKNDLNYMPNRFLKELGNQPKSKKISNIKFLKKYNKNYLILMTQNKVISIPADFCEQKLNSQVCDQNLYPYCHWSEKHSKCFSTRIDPSKIPVVNKTVVRSEIASPIKNVILNKPELKNETNSTEIIKPLNNPNEINFKINIYLFVFILITFILLTIFMCVFIILKLVSMILRNQKTNFKIPILQLFTDNERNDHVKTIEQSYPASQQSSPFEISSTISYTSTKSTKSSIISSNRTSNDNQPESRYVYLKSKYCKPCVLNVNELYVHNDDESDYFSSIHQPKFMTSKSTSSSVSSTSSSSETCSSNRDNYLNFARQNVETKVDLSRKSSILSNSTSNNANRYYL